MRMLAAVVGMLALAALNAAPALAQSAGAEQYGENGEACVKGLLVRATGTLQKPDATSYGYGTHAITDQASGCRYALQSEQVDLASYVGEKVEVTGTTARGYPVDGGPVLLNVSKVEPRSPGGGENATLTFEVDTEGRVPQDATFFGFYGPGGAEAAPLQLTDSDGDGTYTASVELAKRQKVAVKIEKGTGTNTTYSALAGREITLPGEPREVLKGFETITLDGDRTISASYTFSGDGGAESPSNPGNGDDQYTNPGSGGDQYGAGGDQRDDVSGGGGGEDDGASERSIPMLPDTGGPSVAAAGFALFGGLLIAGGILARRLMS